MSHLKASGADNGTKVAIIKANTDKYSISAMCRTLNINRGLVYYTPISKFCDSKLENKIISIFKESRNNYGTRKIKKELEKKIIKFLEEGLAVLCKNMG